MMEPSTKQFNQSEHSSQTSTNQNSVFTSRDQSSANQSTDNEEKLLICKNLSREAKNVPELLKQMLMHHKLGQTKRYLKLVLH